MSNRDSSPDTVVTLSLTNLLLRSRSYRSGGTTLQIASALLMIAHVCLRHKFVNMGVMAPNLLRWGDDLISEPADYTDDLFDDKLNGVSDSDDV